MRLTVRQLRSIINEGVMTEAQPQSFVAEPVDALVRVFVDRMIAMFPQQVARDVIKREANELKSDVLRSLASAAKNVKSATGQKRA